MLLRSNTLIASTHDHPVGKDTQVAPATAAPFGYTKSGKPRKKPLKSARVATPPPPPVEEGICPGCQYNFRHRKNPKQAVWQHLAYYTSNACQAVASNKQRHKEAHAMLKLHFKKKTITGEERKERQKEAKKKYSQVHAERRKASVEKSNRKKKACRQLNKERKELTEENINKRMEELLAI